jgi:EAL domain-containing protein (putative c-di-GMP-specific phosphodiesterase class I)/CheY-like chemotaxis protein
MGAPSAADPPGRARAPFIGAPAMADAVVLVVDDMQANVTLLERLLARAGVGRVVGITDPRQAIEQYHAITPDLILLDLHMPQLDGLAVLKALRGVIPVDSFTPIVVLTADTTFAAKEQALAAGAKDFLTKPFDQAEVLLRINNLLETRHLHLALQRHNAALQAEIRQTNERERKLAEEHRQRLHRVQQVLRHGNLAIVFQPIVDLATLRVAGVEALARFPSLPWRPPNEWFAEGAAVGLGTELELLAVGAALGALDQLPSDTYLSVNVSPATALDPGLTALLAPSAKRIVVELTEHAAVAEYDELLGALHGLRQRGARIAVDDAGSGFSSLQHILRLDPDIIKVDIELTRGIDTDPARRALSAALVTFAAEIGAQITAEGIETAGELDTLRQLGAGYGQGYYLARPGTLPIPPLAVKARHSVAVAR